MEDTNEGRSGTGQAHRAAPTRDAARSITVSVADAAKKRSLRCTDVDLCSHLKVGRHAPRPPRAADAAVTT